MFEFGRILMHNTQDVSSLTNESCLIVHDTACHGYMSKMVRIEEVCGSIWNIDLLTVKLWVLKIYEVRKNSVLLETRSVCRPLVTPLLNEHAICETILSLKY